MRRPPAAPVWFALLLAGLLSGAAATAQPGTPPERVVSLNLCTDQLALLLAQPGQLVSVTFLARRPESSYMAAQAQELHINRGRAEEVLALRPDLVLAGTKAATPTVRLLRQLGYRVESFTLAADFAAIRGQVRRMAGLLGVPARGEALVARFDRMLTAAPGVDVETPRARPVALLYQANGLTAGTGTIVDEVLRAAGLRNMAAELGFAGVATLPLEQMLWSAPDLLVFSPYAPGAPSLGEALLAHPALGSFRQGQRVLHVPSRLWLCPGPMLGEAVALLRAGAAEVRP